MEEPTGVSEVRDWRRKVKEGWQGKSWEEILRELNEAGNRVRAELAEREEETREHAYPEGPPRLDRDHSLRAQAAEVVDAGQVSRQ